MAVKPSYGSGYISEDDPFGNKKVDLVEPEFIQRGFI